MKYFSLSIILFSILALAQEQIEVSEEGPSSTPVLIEAEIEAETASTQGTETVNDASNSSTSSEGRDFDVFRPTEDISEDLAVPFPADI